MPVTGIIGEHTVSLNNKNSSLTKSFMTDMNINVDWNSGLIASIKSCHLPIVSSTWTFWGLSGQESLKRVKLV